MSAHAFGAAVHQIPGKNTMINPLVRLSVAELQARHTVHLYSEIDRLEPTEQSFGTVTGFTEWASQHLSPSLSFSWDWTYDHRSQMVQGHWQSLRTNVRLVDEDGTDLSPGLMRQCVARLMTQLCWERVIADAVGLTLAPAAGARH